MSWLPEYVQKNLKKLRCFICNVKISKTAAEVQYSYVDNGEHKLGKVFICTKCADELDKKNVGSEYDESI